MGKAGLQGGGADGPGFPSGGFGAGGGGMNFSQVNSLGKIQRRNFFINLKHI